MSIAEQKKPVVDAQKRKTALICEDDVDLNNSLQEFLVAQGFTVQSTFDGMQAVNWIQSKSYDLILMDVRIPSMNGLQVCAVARAASMNRTAKIYVMTGQDDPAISARAEALKVNHFLQKPFDLDKLAEAIKKDFEKKVVKPTYDVRIINVFLESAAQVYEFYFHQAPQRGKVSIRTPGQPEKGFCTGLIALTGDGFAGSMGLSMTKPFIKQLADILFAGMEVKYDNEFLADVTGEMCNQILGKVKINFAKLGIGVAIGLPKVIMGENHIIQHLVVNPVIAVPMGRNDAIFELQFVLSQRDVKVGEAKEDGIPPSSVMMFE